MYTEPFQSFPQSDVSEHTIDSPFFARQKKRIFLFFLGGDLVQNRPQNPAPASCLFSTRKSRSEVPEREDFGEENSLGKGGADRAKKGKKDAQKKSPTPMV